MRSPGLVEMYLLPWRSPGRFCPEIIISKRLYRSVFRRKPPVSRSCTCSRLRSSKGSAEKCSSLQPKSSVFSKRDAARFVNLNQIHSISLSADKSAVIYAELSVQIVAQSERLFKGIIGRGFAPHACRARNTAKRAKVVPKPFAGACTPCRASGEARPQSPALSAARRSKAARSRAGGRSAHCRWRAAAKPALLKAHFVCLCADAAE